jgi:hypothetical protein
VSLVVEQEPAEITWSVDGVEVVYGSDIEWWDTKLGRRVRIWGNDE